jgi:hypothetical protein
MTAVTDVCTEQGLAASKAMRLSDDRHLFHHSFSFVLATTQKPFFSVEMTKNETKTNNRINMDVRY